MSETLSPFPAAAPEPIGTFARAIIVESSGHVGYRTLEWVASLVIHVAMVAVLAILPLFFLKALQPHVFTRAFFVSAIPPPSGESQTRPSATRSGSESAFAIAKLAAPLERARNMFVTSADIAPPPEINPLGVTGGISNPLESALNGSPFVVPVPPPSNQIVVAGGSVSGSHLICGFSLAYPALAKMAGIFGRVIIEATIDENGNVQRVRAVSGPEVLAVPALEAVSREKFEPMLLDGRPTSRDLMVEVNFRLF